MKSEIKKLAAEIFEKNPEVDHLLTTGDGNIFLPQASDHARYHAQANGLKVEKIPREGFETALKVSDEQEKAAQEAKEKAAQEANAKAAQEAEAKATQEAEAKTAQEAEAKAAQEAEAKTAQEAEAKEDKNINGANGENDPAFNKPASEAAPIVGKGEENASTDNQGNDGAAQAAPATAENKNNPKPTSKTKNK